MNLDNKKNINNEIYDFTKLKQYGFQIKNKKKFISFCNQYGFYRIINGYAASLLSPNSNQLILKISVNQLIKLVKLDRQIGITLLEAILDFETKFNSLLISTILKTYHLNQDYILDINNSDWLMCSYDERKKLIANLYVLNDSNLLNEYNTVNINKQVNNNVIKPPFISLSLSWTFGTTINLFEHLDISLQKQIVSQYIDKNLSVNSFLWICNILRKLRNKISHNDYVIVSRFKSNNEINNFLDISSKYLFIKDITNFLDIVNETNHVNLYTKNLTNQINKLVKKSRFKFIVKIRVLKYLGYDI